MQKYTVYETELKPHEGPDPSDTDNWTTVYLASEVDARIVEDNATQLRLCEEAQIAAGTIAQQGQRIAELEMLLRECTADSGAEQFLGTDLMERIARSLMER